MRHGKFDLGTITQSERVIAEGQLELDRGVEGIEARVSLDDGSEVTLRGYELRPDQLIF